MEWVLVLHIWIQVGTYKEDYSRKTAEYPTEQACFKAIETMKIKLSNTDRYAVYCESKRKRK